MQVMKTLKRKDEAKSMFHEMAELADGSDDLALDPKIGTVNDAKDMDRMGKKQELRVRRKEFSSK